MINYGQDRGGFASPRGIGQGHVLYVITIMLEVLM